MILLKDGFTGPCLRVLGDGGLTTYRNRSWFIVSEGYGQPFQSSQDHLCSVLGLLGLLRGAGGRGTGKRAGPKGPS